MLRSILNRARSGGRRKTGSGTTGRPTAKPGATGGSANRDIEHGARSLLRGLGRKRGR